VVEKDPNGFQLVETPRGRYWEPGTFGSILPEQLSELDTKYLGFPGLPVQKGGVVLDCGANIGTFTRAALDAGAGVVVAVEPAPENIFCLRKTFSGEIASGRVIVYEKGVWDKDDFLTLQEDDTTSAEDSFVRRDHKHTGPVLPLTTIDKLVQELKLPRVDFIKMDIEGAEQRALKGAQATLARYHPRLEISVNHLPEDPKMVPIIVKQGWPGYRQTLLRCSGDPRHWRIEADIILFD
jgi:FkbM family methyltransferase